MGTLKSLVILRPLNKRSTIYVMLQGGHTWLNPSKRLVDTALDRWNMCKLRADNTSIVTVMLDPPGPPRAQVLRKFHGLPPQISGSSLATPPLPPKLKVSVPYSST